MAIKPIASPAAPPARHLMLASRLKALLREEHAALEDDNVAAVVRLTAAKEQVLGELIGAFGDAGDDSSAPHRQETRRNPVLLAAMREAASANAINAQFVATRLAYARARFAGLMQAGYMARAALDSAGLYKADGFTGGARQYGAYGSA